MNINIAFIIIIIIIANKLNASWIAFKTTA